MRTARCFPVMQRGSEQSGRNNVESVALTEMAQF